MNHRQLVLDRVRRARAGSVPVPVDRRYRRAGSDRRPEIELIREFVERTRDYRALVETASDTRAASLRVQAWLADDKIDTLLVPVGVDPTLVPDGATVVRDHQIRTARELDAVGAVLTTCRLAIAETGTIVLDGGAGQGRRIVTLVPDVHYVIVHARHIVAQVPDAVAALEPRRPLTWISGPSATSDIELHRVEGVHGPRRLRIVVVTDAASDTGDIPPATEASR